VYYNVAAVTPLHAYLYINSSIDLSFCNTTLNKTILTSKTTEESKKPQRTLDKKKELDSRKKKIQGKGNSS